MNEKIKTELVNFLLSKGYKKGRGDSYSKIVVGDKGTERFYRYKIHDISMRKELQIVHEGTEYSKPSKSWNRIWSAYLSDIEVGEKIIVKNRI